MNPIQLRGVHKRFDDTEVLRGVNLEVREGETLALLGRSGSGKTVVLRLVLGLIAPDQGQVLVQGKDLASLGMGEREAVHRDLGVLFQAGALFDSMTALENVMFPLLEREHQSVREARRRAVFALAQVRLSAFEDAYPAALSGGMRKRLAFARAIAHTPKILLLDDPTAGLDPLTTRSVLEIIRGGRERQGVTTLIVTGDPRCAFATADRIAFLHEGRILLTAPPAQFERSTDPALTSYLHRWLQREQWRVPASPPERPEGSQVPWGEAHAP